MTVSYAKRRDWKIIADAIDEIIHDEKNRKPVFFKHLDGVKPFQSRASRGSLHLSLLGKGKYGKVWKASMELQSGRQILIALKAITLPNEEEKLKKSKNEVRMITRLPKHPNLVRYLGSAVLRRHAFIGMELCDGTLDRYIKSPRLYKDRTAQDRSVTRWGMIEQISLGLTIAHRRGIIHRDIKLENTLYTLDRHRGKIVWKIGDFGIAYALKPGELVNERRGHEVYMAPEVRDQKVYDTQADMFSVGVLLEMVHKGDAKSHYFIEAEKKLQERNPKLRMTASGLYRFSRGRWKKERGTKAKKEFKLQDALRSVPADFRVKEVDTRGNIVNGDPRKITAYIVKAARKIIRMFTQRTGIPVKAIEYVFNTELYADFTHGKEELKRVKHYKTGGEVLTFHGTKPKNVDR